MILDALDNSDRYDFLGERFVAAFEFLRRPGLAALEPPADGAQHSLMQPILGDDVYALVQRYRPRLKTQGFWEAHRAYADVQYVVEGAEIMGCAPLRAMRITKAYDPERDYLVLEPLHGEDYCNFVTVRAGMFALFLPSDAHMSGVETVAAGGGGGTVKKIVVKVRVR